MAIADLSIEELSVGEMSIEGRSVGEISVGELSKYRNILHSCYELEANIVPMLRKISNNFISELERDT